MILKMNTVTWKLLLLHKPPPERYSYSAKPGIAQNGNTKKKVNGILLHGE